MDRERQCVHPRARKGGCRSFQCQQSGARDLYNITLRMTRGVEGSGAAAFTRARRARRRNSRRGGGAGLRLEEGRWLRGGGWGG